ncbi:MAG TPA: type IV secretion system protein, partial [Roseiflexaceae bacterium]|nr:type IV secretion system protein [Roseiflexaceae bacterium]
MLLEQGLERLLNLRPLRRALDGVLARPRAVQVAGVGVCAILLGISLIGGGMAGTAAPAATGTAFAQAIESGAEEAQAAGAAVQAVAGYLGASVAAARRGDLRPLAPYVDPRGPAWQALQEEYARRAARGATHDATLRRWGVLYAAADGERATVVTQELWDDVTWVDGALEASRRGALSRATYRLRRGPAGWLVEEVASEPLAPPPSPGGLSLPADVDAPQGSAGGAGGWVGVQQLPPPGDPALMQEPPQEPPPDALGWLGRQLSTGNWVMDAGLGIAGAALGTINEALLVGLRSVLESGVKSDSCMGGVNIITCTSPAFFFDGTSNVGRVIARIWGALEPAAIALIGLLFTVRIGRMIAEGPRSLAAEGRPLLVTFVVALLFTKGAGPLLREMMELLNRFHGLLLSETVTELLEFRPLPAPNVNLGVELTGLVMILVAIGLAVKAVLRVVHLTILISVAPLMGALLMDRATSPRFGQWFGKLVDTLLQQTAWVFFLAIGGLFYADAIDAGATDPAAQVTGRILATVALGMALGGEAALAGIAGAGAAPGGLAGNALA